MGFGEDLRRILQRRPERLVMIVGEASCVDVAVDVCTSTTYEVNRGNTTIRGFEEVSQVRRGEGNTIKGNE